MLRLERNRQVKFSEMLLLILGVSKVKLPRQHEITNVGLFLNTLYSILMNNDHYVYFLQV